MIDQFFHEHQEFLRSAYPGINLFILQREIDECRDLNLPLPLVQRMLLLGVPFAYIKGQSYFYASTFKIAPHIFIPRLESELIVQMGREYIDSRSEQSLNILEIGCGCGAIILSILKEISLSSSRDIRATAIDINRWALQYTWQNYLNLRPKIKRSSLTIYLQDFLRKKRVLINSDEEQVIERKKEKDREEKEEGKYHLIVTNPPYLKESDRVDKSSLHWSPYQSLFVKRYAAWFNLFLKRASTLLQHQGIFIMEGDPHHLKDLKMVAQKYFKKVTLRKDLARRIRFMVAER